MPGSLRRWGGPGGRPSCVLQRTKSKYQKKGVDSGITAGDGGLKVLHLRGGRKAKRPKAKYTKSQLRQFRKTKRERSTKPEKVTQKKKKKKKAV